MTHAYKINRQQLSLSYLSNPYFVLRSDLSVAKSDVHKTVEKLKLQIQKDHINHWTQWASEVEECDLYKARLADMPQMLRQRTDQVSHTTKQPQVQKRHIKGDKTKDDNANVQGKNEDVGDATSTTDTIKPTEEATNQQTNASDDVVSEQCKNCHQTIPNDATTSTKISLLKLAANVKSQVEVTDQIEDVSTWIRTVGHTLRQLDCHILQAMYTTGQFYPYTKFLTREQLMHGWDTVTYNEKNYVTQNINTRIRAMEVEASHDTYWQNLDKNDGDAKLPHPLTLNGDLKSYLDLLRLQLELTKLGDMIAYTHEDFQSLARMHKTFVELHKTLPPFNPWWFKELDPRKDDDYDTQYV